MTASAAFSLPALVAGAAEGSPGATAVRDAEGTFTYAELDARAARIAAALREAGVQPGDRVAIAAEKTRETVAALYGIMRAGAAYVPIDPLAPPLRATAIIQDAACSAVCTDEATTGMLAGLREAGFGAPIVGIRGTVDGASVQASDIETIDGDGTLRCCESDLAYILYTSGSTGTPKGVMLTHRNASAFVEWTVDRFGVRADDRVSSHAPLHFDLSVFDLYGAALAGAEVDLLSPAERSFGQDMVRAVEERRISVWYSVPSALTMMSDIATPDRIASLRVVLFAGEVFPIKHLARLRSLLPNAVLANLYGPTETNVCTYHVVPPTVSPDDPPLPIGKACENQEVFALDESMHPVGQGVVGELWVRGPTVMKGYWGDAERTKKTLIQNPLHDRFPDPAYRTGDLVRLREDGAYDFLGRRDHQIKVRGYRIELGDIEAALLSHPAVKEAAVIDIPDEKIGARLVAVVVANGVTDLELKKHCKDRLPRYMIPSSVHVHDDLPRTSTGKIDRRALLSTIPEASSR